jgi:Dicarboxylate transport
MLVGHDGLLGEAARYSTGPRAPTSPPPATLRLVVGRSVLRWLAGALLLGLVAAVAFVWWQRTALAETIALRALAARGVPASLRVVRLDLAGLEARELRVGDATTPDLTVEQATLAWSWRGLREGRLDRIEVSGVRLRGRLGEQGLELGALDPLLGGDGSAAPAAALPLAEARLRDVTATLETARGQIRLRAEGQVETPDPRSRRILGVVEASGQAPFGSGSASLRLSGSLDAPHLDFTAQLVPDASALGVRVPDPIRAAGSAELGAAGGAAGEATLEAKRLELPGLVRLSDLSVSAKLDAGALAAELRAAQLVELSKPALVAPLAVEATLAGTLEQLALRGRARTGPDGFALTFDGTLEPAAQSVKLAIHAAETELAPAARQPAKLFPRLEGLILRAKGRAAFDLDVGFAARKLSARAQLAFRDVDLRTRVATFRRLNGLVTLLGPEPLRTPPGQVLSVGLIEAALPLSDGLLRFELQRGQLLQVEQARFGLAGGTLSFSGPLPLAAEERALVLTAERLSVEQLLKAMEFEGLSGTGFLDGRLPLEQHGQQLQVVGGVLRASGPGVIRYKKGAGSGAVAAGQPQLAPVLGALEDLRYESLELELSGDVSKQLDVKVHVRGNNPNFQQGRAVVLNVNVEAPVQSLLRSGLSAYRVPEEIEMKVKRFFERSKR